MPNLKTALVTGANSGIGLAITEILLENNYKVVAHYNFSSSNLEKLKSPNLITKGADFSDQENIRYFLKSLEKENIVIDILINNAGTYDKAKSFQEIDLSNFKKVLRVNLEAAFLLSQKLINGMLSKGWGRIINISSCNFKHGGSSKSVHYTISKSSLEVLSKAISKDFANKGITSNSIRAGFIDTKFHDQNSEKSKQERAKLNHIKRVGSPREVADTVLFLCSESSSFVTGTVIEVDGGE